MNQVNQMQEFILNEARDKAEEIDAKALQDNIKCPLLAIFKKLAHCMLNMFFHTEDCPPGQKSQRM